jgi:hypothetical protein
MTDMKHSTIGTLVRDDEVTGLLARPLRSRFGKAYLWVRVLGITTPLCWIGPGSGDCRL